MDINEQNKIIKLIENDLASDFAKVYAEDIFNIIKNTLEDSLEDGGGDTNDIKEQILDEIGDYVSENVMVVYYSNAIKYLAEVDPSLMDSMEIAYDLGYSPEDINSELLATLLLQDKMKEIITENIDSYIDAILEYLNI